MQRVDQIALSKAQRPLVKLLGLLGSDHNGEIASAGRMADALIREAGVTWADVITPDTVRRELVEVLRAENDELREKVHRLLVENNELQVRTRASQALYNRKRNKAKRIAALIIALMTVLGILAYFRLFD
jgi:hypothetical protein